jgi:hypothetical protein
MPETSVTTPSFTLCNQPKPDFASNIRKHRRRERYTDRQQGDLMGLFSFFQNNERSLTRSSVNNRLLSFDTIWTAQKTKK